VLLGWHTAQVTHPLLDEVGCLRLQQQVDTKTVQVTASVSHLPLGTAM
jgi:hypothetical protein